MSSRTNAFLLACGTALGATGCGTAPQYQGNPLSSITAGIRDAANSVSSGVQGMMSGTPSEPPQQVQAAPQAAREMPVGSRVLHPAVQPYINNITWSRNQTPFDTNQCNESALQGRGPSSAATNPAAVGNVQGRGTEIIRQGTRRILGNGTFGQIMTPGVDATLDTANASAGQRSIICGNIGQVSQRFFQADRMPAASQEATFTTGYNTLSSIMTRAANAGLVGGENAGAGSSAMVNRGWNQSQTIGWGKLLNKVYTPKGNGAVWDFVK